MVLAAAALVGSIYRTRDRARRTVIHAIVDETVGDELLRLRQDLSDQTFDIKIIRTDPEEQRLRGATCFRLRLDRYLPNLDRVLYLDVDLIVRRDLAALHDHPLSNFPIAAMPDYGLNTFFFTGNNIEYGEHRMSVDRYVEDIVRTSLADYFNAGVMLVNLSEWRRIDLGERCITELGDDPHLRFLDQDVLNRIIGDRYVRLDPRWNSISFLGSAYGDSHFAGMADCPALQDIRMLWAEDPWIVHFASDSKPWMPNFSRSGFEGEFWDNVDYTRVGRALRHNHRGLTASSVTSQSSVPMAANARGFRTGVATPADITFARSPTFLLHAPAQERERPLPLLSFIVTNYNYASYLPQCVESILYQDYPLIECIVIDDASRDNSRTVLAKLKKQHPSLKVHFRSENGGQSASAVDGYHLSRGSFLAFVDADDFLLPNFATTHIHAHLALPNTVGFTSCDMAQMFDEEIVSGTYFNTIRRDDPRTVLADDLRAPSRISSSASRLFNTKHLPRMIQVNTNESGWVWAPTSGNVYRRTAISLFIDNPLLSSLRNATDAYFNYAVNSFSGSVLIDQALAVYRIHGRNNFTLNAPLNGFTFYDRSKDVTAFAAYCAFQHVISNYPKFREHARSTMHLANAARTLYRRASNHPEKWLALNAALSWLLNHLWRSESRSLEKIFLPPKPNRPWRFDRRPKIAIVNLHMAGLGGGEQQTLCLAAHLARRYDVGLFVGRNLDRKAFQRGFGINLRRVKIIPTRYLNVDAAIDSWGPDLLISNTPVGNLPCRAPAGIYMCLFPGKGQLCPVGYDVITANSDFTAKWIRRLWNCESEVVYSTGHDMGPPKKKEKIILNVGRFATDQFGGLYKRQDVLVSAFARMKDAIYNGWELHLVGDITSDLENRAPLEDLYHLAKHLPVRIHTGLDHGSLRDLYRRASLYWHAVGFQAPRESPELQEHFGLTIVEGMSAGTVPLVFDGGGPPATINDGASGYVYKDIDDLVEKTQMLLSSPKRLADMSAQALVDSQYYTEAKFLARMDQIVDRLIAKESKPISGEPATVALPV